MAAFSYQQLHPFLLDSIFLPNTPVIRNMSMEDGNLSINCFSQFYTPEPVYETPLEVSFHEGSHFDHSSKIALSDNETSVTKKQSTDSSTVVDKLESGEQVTQKVSAMEKKRKNANGSSLNSSPPPKDARAKKSKKEKKSNGEVKEEEKKPKSEKKDKKNVHDEPSTGYIHVRARRGQATDSHSLAERLRREKISERMKMLQRLVPGCDKVTGKAQMLDEIINYVQSLQDQVEFLSMKLASFNPLFYDFGMELDPLVIRPEILSSLQGSSLPGWEQCSRAQLTAFADANTILATNTTGSFDTANNYPLVDNSASLLLQGHKDSGSVFWDAEEERQKLVNPSGFGNNLCSFH